MSAGHGRSRRRGGHGGGGHEGGDERWLLTYADMITLLMALFMVLFSISSVNISKYQVLQHALQKAFIGGVLDGGKGVQSGNPTRITGVQTATPSGAVDSSFNIFTRTLDGSGANSVNKAKAAAKEQSRLLEIQRKVETYARQHGFANDINSTIDERGLVIRILTNNLVFDSGQATLKPTATPLLSRVAALIVSMHLTNQISVEGNTDDVPISGGPFPSNWELSTARATAVLEFMLHHGVLPHHLAAVGYADQNPVAPNTTSAGRALNRRVDIVVVRSSSTPAK